MSTSIMDTDTRLRCALALCAVLAPACSELPDAVERDAELYVGLYEGWGETAASHEGDCQAMGEALEAFADRHAVELKAVEARIAALPDDQLAAFRERYDPRLEAVQPRIAPLFRCLDHPAVQRALDKI